MKSKALWTLGLVLSLGLSGCSGVETISESETQITGITAIAVQTTSDISEETTTVITETSEEVPVGKQVWVYNNFNGIDLEANDFNFSVRRTVNGEAEAIEFINNFLTKYNGNSPFCLFEAGEYSVYEYLADHGTIIVYQDDLGKDISAASDTSTEDTSVETAAPEESQRIVECYYLDYNNLSSIGELPEEYTSDPIWDRIELASDMVSVLDKWNIEAPSDYIPEVVDDYTMLTFKFNPSDEGVTYSSGRIFLDDMGHPMFARYYMTNVNLSELFLYNSVGEVYSVLRFSGGAFAENVDGDGCGIQLAAYIYDENIPDMNSFRTNLG